MTNRHRSANADSSRFFTYLDKLSETIKRLCLFAVAGALFLVSGTFIQGCAAQNLEVQAARERRPFFQSEQGTETHGRKDWFDRVIEVDPGRLEVEMASDYEEHPPAVIAVMPFCDKGSGNFTIDKIPITFRNTQAQNKWAWTDSQRLRRSVMGHLAQREFVVINPIAVDAVLQRHGINNMDQLRKTSPIEIGRLLNADALMYGEVNSYEGYYFGIVSVYRVGISTWMLSTRDGETLMRETGSRYSVDVSPALSPEDFLINSALTLLDFRDIALARAEEEVSRELVLRIPVSEKLKQQLAAAAIAHSDEVEAQESEAELGPRIQEKTSPPTLASSATLSQSDSSHFEGTSFHSSADTNIHETNWPVAK
jgi:hypothetical protein